MQTAPCICDGCLALLSSLQPVIEVDAMQPLIAAAAKAVGHALVETRAPPLARADDMLLLAPDEDSAEVCTRAVKFGCSRMEACCRVRSRARVCACECREFEQDAPRFACSYGRSGGPVIVASVGDTVSTECFVACGICMLHVACWLVFVVCCMLHVACGTCGMFSVAGRAFAVQLWRRRAAAAAAQHSSAPYRVMLAVHPPAHQPIESRRE